MFNKPQSEIIIISLGKDFSVLINDNPTGITCRRTISYRGRIAKPGHAMFIITGPRTKMGRPQLVQEFKSSSISQEEEIDYRNELIKSFIKTFKL